MIEKSTIQKVFSIFIDNPNREFHLRELCRLLSLSMPTIISTTNILAKKKLLVKFKDSILTKCAANMDNVCFIRHKRIYNLENIYFSGIIEFLSNSYNRPQCIILFGSFARGEDIEKSDIDIAIVTHKRLDINLEKYSRILKRDISLHHIALDKISDELKANLANGIVLEGSW